MPDQNLPPDNGAKNEAPHLDPKNLPYGVNFDADESDHFQDQMIQAGRTASYGRRPILARVPPPDVTLLYPFLFAAFPKWTYGVQGIGDCLAWSQAHCMDLESAVNVHLRGRKEEIRAQIATETTYGFMRVQAPARIHNNTPDGATPPAAAQAALSFGCCHRLEYKMGPTSIDLSYYQSKRAKEFGRRGTPRWLHNSAAQHLCEDAILVTSFDEAVSLLSAGYSISNAAPNNPIYTQRDRAGFGTQQIQRPHAMNYIGYRHGRRPGLFKSNTGHGRHVTGPRVPTDMPDVLAACSSWEDAETSETILRQGWSYAYTGFKGFPLTTLTPGHHLYRLVHSLDR